MKVKAAFPLALVKRISKVAARKKISFNDAVIFLLQKVNSPKGEPAR